MRSHHFTLLSCLALALLFLTCPSLAQPRVARGPLKPAAKPPRARVAVALDNGPARFGSVEARAGQQVTLYLVLTRSHQGRFTLYYTDAPRLEDPKQIDAVRLRPIRELGEIHARWYQIEPQPHHVNTPSPNFGNPAYSNAKLFGKDHGEWLGMDQIEYTRALILDGESTLETTGVNPSPPWPNHDDLGTMRYQVEVDGPGWRAQTPGLEALEQGGIKTSVQRVSYRQADDWLGWMTSYFNVPTVFGSAGKGRNHQTEKHQGADCADVLIGGLRKAGVRVDYSSVMGLYTLSRPVTDVLLLNEAGLFTLNEAGQPATALRLTREGQIQRGDIMVIDYAGLPLSKQVWDHVAVVGDDRGEIGVFDPQDPVYHMGYFYGLTEEAAGTGWPKRVQFLRLKPRYLPKRQ